MRRSPTPPGRRNGADTPLAAPGYREDHDLVRTRLGGPNLREFLQQRQAIELQPSDVAYILKTAAREILPGAGLQRRCRQLEVFTDSVAHGEITNSAVGAAALIKIADAIRLHGSDAMHDDEWLERRAVNADLSFWKLRLELDRVLATVRPLEGMFTC